MKCSICGKEGHNRRTCTNEAVKKEEKRDRAMIMRLDNMTEEEQVKMHVGLVKLKKENTSDEVQATLVQGKSKELPSKIRQLIEEGKDE